MLTSRAGEPPPPPLRARSAPRSKRRAAPALLSPTGKVAGSLERIGKLLVAVRDRALEIAKQNVVRA